MQNQSNDFDNLNAVKDMLSRENNVLFNISGSNHEYLDMPSKVGIDLLNDLSFINDIIINIIYLLIK
jgi:hypothetical protein